MSITFTAAEIRKLEMNPDALDALICEHDFSASAAESIGCFQDSLKYHMERIEELKAARDKINAEI